MNSLKTYLPITPSLRGTMILDRKHLDKVKKPLKDKTFGLIRKKGRNNQGRITVFTKGGGHKRNFRRILENRILLSGIIESIEYDPNRSADIARIFSFTDKTHYYILAPQKLKRGDYIDSRIINNNLLLKIGNLYKLKDLPLGVSVYDLSFSYKKSGVARAAGCKAVLISKSDKFYRVKLNSGEFKLYPLDSVACLGVVSNPLHKLVKLGKAGRSRWLGRRPSVRGVAMNPIDHPHGGGEGKTSGGRVSVTPWGKITKGQPTSKSFKNKY